MNHSMTLLGEFIVPLSYHSATMSSWASLSGVSSNIVVEGKSFSFPLPIWDSQLFFLQLLPIFSLVPIEHWKVKIQKKQTLRNCFDALIQREGFSLALETFSNHSNI